MEYKEIVEAQEFLVLEWGEAGKAVIEAAFNSKNSNMRGKEFLSHCTACGGDWGQMLLSGIKRLWPKVWDAIPDNMGPHAFTCLMEVLCLCGVDFKEDGE